MNNNVKRKAPVNVSPSDPATSDALPIMPALSKNSKALSRSKGKVKERGEPLLGRVCFIFPSIHLTDSSPFQSIPHLSHIQPAASALNNSGLRTLPFPHLWQQVLLLACHSVSACRAPGDTHTASRA